MIASTRETIVNRIGEATVSAILRTDDRRVAERAMHAAVDGGFRMIEFTLTTPGALDLVRNFSRIDGLLVGAGTVMTTDQVAAAVDAGAKFIVSPISDPVILAAVARHEVATIPGAYTPTEMEAAHRAGADIIKVFPAPPGGVEFIRALRGPLPHLKLFPTAGPTPDNFLEYLDAGCFGVGFVRSLFEPQDLADGRFDRIQTRAREVIERLSARRNG